jgi:uncharacterized protein
MTLLDANVLLYAYNDDVPEQRPVALWLENLLANGEMIGLPWLTLWAFIRISTNPRLWPRPRSAAEAVSIVSKWVDEPGTVVLHPGPAHARILEKLILQYRVSGGLVTDAALAALAIEHGATLASADRDFARFTELRWVNPLDA